ncbi:MAG: UvrD-helicase domain-containing protein [Synergistaceae bacterium]|nr:UvrD-helicase domain-containing protein [Synergistaceae bacterium]
MIAKRSSLDFTSNIEVVRKDQIFDDHDFLSRIIDPMVLPELCVQYKIYKNTGYQLNQEQSEIYHKASLACSKNHKNDYPWGVVMKNGRPKPVCGCINENCENFGECRPDFSRDELDVLKENEKTRLERVAIASQILLAADSGAPGDDDAELGGDKSAPDEIKTLSLGNRDDGNSSSSAERTDKTPEAGEDREDREDREDGEDAPRAGIGADLSLIGEVAAMERGDEAAVTNWYFMHGPYPEEHIRVLIAKNLIRRDTPIWSVRDDRWVKAEGIAEFGEMFAAESKGVSADAGAYDGAVSLAGEASERRLSAFDTFKDVDQREFITSPPGNRVIVNAGPGTGKTWSLVEKLAHLMEAGGTKPENIFVLCFSRAAVNVIETRLRGMSGGLEGGYSQSWRRIEIRTFDSFATYMISRVIKNWPNLLSKGYSLDSQDYGERIETAMKILKKKADMFAGYEHFLVDEVQDLVGVRAELVLRVLKSLPQSCGFSLLGDACQAVYDYLSVYDKSIMSSGDFYRELFESYPDARLLSFASNHRQGAELAKLGEKTVLYRNWILRGNYSKMNEIAEEIRETLPKSPIDLKRPDGGALREVTGGRTLGILTRTNAQSITISARLRSEDVEHTLLRHSEANLFGRWIADVFMNYPHETMGRREFDEIFRLRGPKVAADSAGMFWNALLSSQPGAERGYYEVEELLRGIYHGARDELLFRDDRDEPGITVSNVHKVKGREFDSVILIDEIFEDWNGKNESDISSALEHKVRYVALTRAKREVTLAELSSKGRIYRDKNSGRCFKSNLYSNSGRGHFGKRAAGDETAHCNISHFEVGLKDDINDWEFARDKAAQDYIRGEIRPHDKLVLKKCPEEYGPHVVYKITPNSNENLALGYTSKKFHDALTRAIRRVFNNIRYPMKYKHYPNELHDIYVDRLTTLVSEYREGFGEARVFGEIAVWTGISFFGLAKSVE